MRERHAICRGLQECLPLVDPRARHTVHHTDAGVRCVGANVYVLVPGDDAMAPAPSMIARLHDRPNDAAIDPQRSARRRRRLR